MLTTFHSIHLFYLTLAILLEVIANVLMKFSRGFQYKSIGIAAILCALTAFTSLSFAVHGIQLSVAYGIWGGVGMIATALLGLKLFNEKIKPLGWLGILLVMIGVILIEQA